VLDLDHAVENCRRVIAVWKCFNDDPATLDQAEGFVREAYDALGDTGPLALGMPGDEFVQVHDYIEHAVLEIGDEGSPGARDAAKRALIYLVVILAAAVKSRKSRGRREPVLPFLVRRVLVVAYVGAAAVMAVTTDLIGTFGPKHHLLEAYVIAFAVCLLILLVGLPTLVVVSLGLRKWRRARRHRLAETHKMASQRINAGGSGGTQPSAEPTADASPASEDYQVGRWKLLDGLLARLDYGPVVRVLARQAIGCEEPLHQFWAVVQVGVGGTRRKRLVVATRSRLWIIDHARSANTGTISHTITYPEITGFEKRVFNHRIYVNIETPEGPVRFKWGSTGSPSRGKADALTIILRRRSHLPAPIVRTRKKFSLANFDRLESSSAAKPDSHAPVEK
jgi:hypothetical protein